MKSNALGDLLWYKTFKPYKHHRNSSVALAESIVVYVQPNGAGDDIINFNEFRAIVQKHDDTVSARFAQSLQEWASTKAGER